MNILIAYLQRGKTSPTSLLLPSQERLQNTLPASLQRGKTPSMNVLWPSQLTLSLQRGKTTPMCVLKLWLQKTLTSFLQKRKTPPMSVLWPSQLWQQKTLTAFLQKGKTAFLQGCKFTSPQRGKTRLSLPSLLGPLWSESGCAKQGPVHGSKRTKLCNYSKLNCLKITLFCQCPFAKLNYLK